MSWTKEQLVDEAFSVLALDGSTFDLTPEEKQTALRRLDTMMGTWNGKGIRLGYPLHSNPKDASLSEDSGLPDAAIETVYMNLAIRIAPTFGKMVSQDTKVTAKAGYDVLLARAAMPPEMQFPNILPRGAGNKRSTPFMPTPTDPLEAGGDGPIEFN